MNRVVVVVAAGLSLAGCAGDMSTFSFLSPTPPTETLQLESEPPGAEAKTSMGPSCRTPCTLPVATTSEFSVTFTLAGYQPQTVPVTVKKPVGLADPEAVGPLLAPNPVYAELAAVPPPARRSAPRRQSSRATQPAAQQQPAEASPFPTPR